MFRKSLNRNLLVSLVCFAIAAIAASFISCAAVVPRSGINCDHKEYLLGRILKQWPNLVEITASHPGNIIIQDTNYYIPTPDEAWEQIHSGTWIEKSPNGDKYDCDDFAVDTMMRVQHGYHGEGVFAIGVCGYPGHMQNLVITTNGVLLYEVRRDIMQKSGPEVKPYFIWI